MKAAAAAALTNSPLPTELGEYGGTPATTSLSEPLAVMTTETGLEDYRRWKEEIDWAGTAKARRRLRCERHVPLLGEGRYRRSRLQQRNNKWAQVFAGDRVIEPTELTRDGQKRWYLDHTANNNKRSTTGIDNHHNHRISQKSRRRPRGRLCDGQIIPPVDGHVSFPEDGHTTSPVTHRGHAFTMGKGAEKPLSTHDTKPQTKTVVKLASMGEGGHSIVGGSTLVCVDGVISKSPFPRGDAGSYRGHCGGGVEVGFDNSRDLHSDGAMSSSKVEAVVRRLCDPKSFTGTAATGHLPITVDLEEGADVLLKDASIAVKDHVGTQEVSWRLRLAERL